MIPISSRKWMVSGLLLLALFSFVRIYQLDRRPMHNDESVNAMFIHTLVLSNRYKYDPSNYHGPSLYFMHLTPVRINALLKDGFKNFKITNTSGLTQAALRFPVAIAGILVLVGCFFLKKRIGLWGSLTALALLGFSCNLLYFSRYFIHEIYVVLFTFGIYLMGVFYNDTKKASYLYGLLVFASLLFATKETSAVHFFVLGFSVFCAQWTHALFNGQKISTSTAELFAGMKENVLALRFHLLGALALGLFIWATLFSSFYIHWDGLLDSFRAYQFWGHQGLTSGHTKNFYYFFQKILFQYEFGLTVLSFLGLVVIFLKHEKKGLYLGFWMMGMLGAYSVVPYKTPWCVINMVLPMALVSGYGVHYGLQWMGDQLTTKNQKTGAIVFLGSLAILILFQVPHTLRVVFWEYDKADHVQVYQHTDRDAYNLVDEIEVMSEVSGEGRDIEISITSPEYWPLPYYLRDYSNLKFVGPLTKPETISSPLVIAHGHQRKKMNLAFQDKYTERSFLFRQGVNMILYVRNDIMDKSENRSRVIPDRFEAVALEPARLKPGLVKVVYHGMRFRRDPIEKKYGVEFTNFNWRILEDRAYRHAFSATWSGYIKIDEEGTYGFSLESDDGSLLYIDDVLVIDNGGMHMPERKTRDINMKPGYHRFELKYFDWVGEAVLTLKWAPLGKGWRRIPQRHFFYNR